MRKILVSLLVASMILGLVGTVSAGFSDTSGNKYIDKVTAFGWMNGYPDGAFKPSGNITRAEAATAVVRALGLEAAAQAARGLTTKFSDVPADHWASGYINVCTTKGILKGYPDNTFKPSANITGAESITMIVRALNREYQAVGEWPIGHITVAAAEKIIGSGFVSNTLATRGQVAEYISKASEVVFAELTTNGWVTPEGGKTFCTSSGYELDPEVPIAITAVDTVEKTLNGNIALADNYVIVGGTALKDLIGYTCKLFRNDDDEVVVVEPTTKTTTKTGQLRMVGAEYFYLYDDTTKYILASGAEFYRNGVQKAVLSDIKVDDNVEFFRDASGKVTLIKATVYDLTHRTVLSVYTGGEQSTWNIKVGRGSAGAFQQATYYLNNETIVVLDGNTVTLKDIKEDMVCSIQTDGSNLAKYINVSSKKVSGKVTSKRLMTDTAGDSYYYFTVDAVEYRLESNVWIEDGSAYASSFVYNAIPVNSQITAVLSVRNRLGFITESTTAAQYGRVTSFNAQEGNTGVYDRWVVDVKGVSTTYEVGRQGEGGTTGTSWHGHLTATHGITTDSYIRIVLDANGRITDGTVPAPFTVGPALVEDVFPGDKLIKVTGAGYYSVGESAVMYIDGVYTTGLAGVAKNASVKIVPKGTELKVELIVIDTYSKLNLSNIVAQANGVVVGTGAVERGSTIKFYPTSAMNETDKYTTVLSVVTSDKYGDFSCTVSMPPLPTGTPVGTTQTIYIKVIDPMGMEASASLKVYPVIGGVVQPTVAVTATPSIVYPAVGGTAAITASASPATATLSYVSANPSIALVTATGTVFGVAAGNTTITVTGSLAGYTSGTALVSVAVGGTPPPAPIASVGATNGDIYVVFNTAPDPVPSAIGDFTVTQSINGGAATPPAGLAFVDYNTTTKVAHLTFTAINPDVASQSVVITAKYKTGTPVAAPAFVVAPLGIASVNATNGTINVVLNGVPSPAPVVGDFTLTKSIDGGAPTQLTATLGTWNSTTKTAPFTFTAIPPAEAVQSVVITASYKGASAVPAPAFTVDPLAAVTIQSVSATNGTVTVTLNRAPAVTPVAGDFEFKIAIDGGTASALTVGGFNWNAGNKQAFFVFAPVSSGEAEQSVVISAKYKTGNFTNAPAFIVAALPPVAITGVSATNGTVTVTLNRAPATAPVAADFEFTIAIDSGDADPLTVGGFGWNATNKQAIFTFAPVEQTDSEQSVVVSASYKEGDAVAASAFTVPAET